MDNVILNLLRTLPLFATLSEEQHQQITEHITLEYFPEGYVLFKEGDVGDALYLVKSGKVQITKQDKVLAELIEGDFFGEMALMDAAPRNANAILLEDSELFRLNKSDFDRLLEKNPDIAEAVRAAYALRKEADEKLF